MAQVNITREELRRLVPLDALSGESIEKVIARARVEQLPAGRTLFRSGELDKTAVYLLRGTVSLVNGEGKARDIVGGSQESMHALGHYQPRQATAMTTSDAIVLRLDNELLDILLTWDQSTGYIVEELTPDMDVGDDADWMTRMLRSNIFFRVPAANIQAILTRMESVRARAGDLIVEQEGDGDYFYIIKSGCAEVIRKAAGGREVKLAEKGVGDGFGEEALMSSAQRNATVRMVTDGELMRLAKRDFEQSLKEPLLQEVSLEQANIKVGSEGAVWVDVRLENEFSNDHIAGSINLPLYLLRIQSKRLPEGKPLIVYCDTGRRSSAAAYLLSERGFDVYVLKGGYRTIGESKVA
jgi:CRP-like cAMP-binding protein